MARKNSLKHDPEKWEPVFGKRSCSNKELKRDDNSNKNHPALGRGAVVKSAFLWLCLVCFCIVLAAIALGAFELLYFSEHKTTLLGCQVGELAAINCNNVFMGIVLNLPFGFIVGPIFLLRPPPMAEFLGMPDTWWAAYPFLVYLHHPLFLYLYTLDLILLLAIIHACRLIVRLTMALSRAGRPRNIDGAREQ
jgi:hypothetical protein